MTEEEILKAAQRIHDKRKLEIKLKRLKELREKESLITIKSKQPPYSIQSIYENSLVNGIIDSIITSVKDKIKNLEEDDNTKS